MSTHASVPARLQTLAGSALLGACCLLVHPGTSDARSLDAGRPFEVRVQSHGLAAKAPLAVQSADQTVTELRVSRIAADGLTNREIAQALFVTEKTIEGHLANAYRKLGISSRVDLVGQLGGA